MQEKMNSFSRKFNVELQHSLHLMNVGKNFVKGEVARKKTINPKTEESLVAANLKGETLVANQCGFAWISFALSLHCNLNFGE